MFESNKRIVLIVVLIATFIAGFFLGKNYVKEKSFTKQTDTRKIKYWQAPMDPNYVRDKPGKSPMGMDLIPVYADDENEGSIGSVKIDPVTVQNMGVKTQEVKYGTLKKTIRAVGHLDYDERKVWQITTKMDGWIEKLYVSYEGQKVKKGDPLFDIYSPKLVSAQEEYLLSVGRNRGTGKNVKSLYKSSRKRLKYWDINDKQIDTLEKTGVVNKTLTIYSPYDGIVVNKKIVEGMFQKAGTKLYQIADISSIWAYVHIYEYELPWIKTGLNAKMELSYIPGKTFDGKVTYIYPYLSKATRDVKIRLEFDNPKFELKPDMYANMKIESLVSENTIIISEEAIINTGKRQIVFVTIGDGKFLPHEVIVGIEGEGGMVQILEGLNEGDMVVTSGQFLIDSESRMQEAISKMMDGEKSMAEEITGHEGHKMEEMDQSKMKEEEMDHSMMEDMGHSKMKEEEMDHSMMEDMDHSKMGH